jgi:hypothetical protein
MSKSTVTRVFIAGLIAVAAGAILTVAAVSLAFATNVFITAGTDVVDVRASSLAWSLLGLGIVGGVAVIGGLITGLVAWIGALLNTRQLESKTWFAVLLLTGIFNFGFIAMVAYVIAGPDGTATGSSRVAPAPAAA